MGVRLPKTTMASGVFDEIVQPVDGGIVVVGEAFADLGQESVGVGEVGAAGLEGFDVGVVGVGGTSLVGD
jgi:hypothetical protein